MLDSLQIKGFKLFQELTVPKLARLNLFVGANNSGKSCLLEAVRLYASGGNANVLRDLVRSRDGDWEVKMAERGSDAAELSGVLENPIRFLFHGFHYGNGHRAAIEISHGPSHLTLSVHRRQVYGSAVSEDEEPGASLINGVPIEALTVNFDSEKPLFYDLEKLWISGGYPAYRPLLSAETTRRPAITVGPKGTTPSEVSLLWDNVSLTPQQGRVIDCLRMIEPRIEGLALIGRHGDRTPVVKLADVAERLPLRSMGDGLSRLFHIALSLVNAENDILLIDEFENGLYWEVQEQLWPVIFELAEELNVQVFATTHSNDCLKSFVNAWTERPELATMYRLERSRVSTRAFPLPMVNVAGALTSEIEVR